MLRLGVPSHTARAGFSLGVCASLSLALLAHEAFAAKASPRARRAQGRAQAVVTYVSGSVTILGGRQAGRKVAVKDALPSGTRLRLEKSSQVTVLWADGGRPTTLRGPVRSALLASPSPSKAPPAPRPPSLVARIWQAITRALGGRRANEVTWTAEPMAVRGPGEWQMQPSDEYVRPDSVTLSWQEPSGSTGQYLVMLWDDATSASIWAGAAQGNAIALPASAHLVAGRPYQWAVASLSNSEASPRRRFVILTPARAASLAQELECARDLFQGVDPPSQLHAVIGRVYDDYGLLSEARAEYEMAAKLSPVYQVLLEDLDRTRLPDAGTGSGGR